jgi:hypothetical protein
MLAKRCAKVALRSAMLVGALLWGVGSASAVTIFSDDFTRANSNTVGNGWLETGGPGNGSGIAIVNNQLVFSANATLTLTQGTLVLSTAGLTNITLSYDWQGVRVGGGETLAAAWSLDGTNFTTLGTHNLSPASTSMNHASWTLPASAEGLADLTIRFIAILNNGNDVARLDNVLVTGEPVLVPNEGAETLATPLPAALPLFATIFGAGGLIGWRRRRQAGQNAA